MWLIISNIQESPKLIRPKTCVVLQEWKGNFYLNVSFFLIIIICFREEKWNLLKIDLGPWRRKCFWLLSLRGVLFAHITKSWQSFLPEIDTWRCCRIIGHCCCIKISWCKTLPRWMAVRRACVVHTEVNNLAETDKSQSGCQRQSAVNDSHVGY